jgi:tRNA-binding EMAP/Myf-like protein
MYCGYIVRIKELRKHSNADRLQVATVFGNDTIVGLDVKIGDMMVYFPTDGRLNMGFCEANNLLRKKDEQGNEIGGYLDPNKRHVSSVKLRGEKSDGLLLNVNSLHSFTDVGTLKEGDTISILNGVEICNKYIPQTNHINGSKNTGMKVSNSKKISLKNKFPYFSEHRDTEQLAYNMAKFKEGDICTISLKMHGTSLRESRAFKITQSKWNSKLPRFILNLLYILGVKFKSTQEWDYVSGSRRVILNTFDGGFYGTNKFREQWHNFFLGKLHKGETVYGEIVGYTESNQLIMPECNNSKTKDKEFIKQYGETTRFTYRCNVGENKVFVYRMTMTNEDGIVVEYPTELTQMRCEQMGIEHVPVFEKFIYTTQEDLMQRVNKYTDGVDPIGKSHIREGIVVRIENREKFTALKNKNFTFKVLEGIIKSDDVLDIEEAQSVQDE